MEPGHDNEAFRGKGVTGRGWGVKWDSVEDQMEPGHAARRSGIRRLRVGGGGATDVLILQLLRQTNVDRV